MNLVYGIVPTVARIQFGLRLWGQRPEICGLVWYRKWKAMHDSFKEDQINQLTGKDM